MSYINKFLPYFGMGLGLLACPDLAFAQNTSGVVGPVVKPGEAALEYRLGIDPEKANGETGIGQRLHYQRAVNDSLRWRLVGRFRKTDDSDFDFDYVQAELVWQLTEDDTRKYHTGLRFDARLRGDSRPGQLGVNWSHQWATETGWEFRGVLKSTVQIGQNSDGNLSVESQGRLRKKLSGGKSIGIKMFNDYGDTDNIKAFDDQEHVAGPFVSLPVTENLDVFGGALFGLTEASPDTQIQLWLTRSF